jgi:hypothetical protein
MQIEDRVIHFSAELIHPPLSLDRQQLQKLYYDLSQTRAVYDSIDISTSLQAKFHSQRDKAQSIMIHLPERLMMIEEWADIPLSTFIEKLRIAVPLAMESQKIPHIMLHALTVRSTFALTHFEDARVFLLDNACQLAGRIQPHFQRPLATGGLRFVFPETNEHRGSMHVNIESFRHSTNEIFVEVKGIFGRQALTSKDVEVIAANLQMTRNFISEHVFPFLQQFDATQEKA